MRPLHLLSSYRSLHGNVTEFPLPTPMSHPGVIVRRARHLLVYRRPRQPGRIHFLSPDCLVFREGTAALGNGSSPRSRNFSFNPFSSGMKAKGKGHVFFPNRRLYRPALPLQAFLAKPRLNRLIWGGKCVFSLCLLNRHSILHASLEG